MGADEAGAAAKAKDTVLTRHVTFLRPNTYASGNTITTSKYTVLSFVPKCLFGLLPPIRRFANFYFLCISALLTVSVCSLTSGVPTTLGTRTFRLAWDM